MNSLGVLIGQKSQQAPPAPPLHFNLLNDSKADLNLFVHFYFLKKYIKNVFSVVQQI